MAVANALGQRGSKSVTAGPLKSPMMAWGTACDDYFRVATRWESPKVKPSARSSAHSMLQLPMADPLLPESEATR
jgi:hypothetical protein